MSHGIYQLQPDVNHLSQLSVVTMPAMSNRVGGVMQGAGVSIDTTGLLTLAPATSNIVGGVKIGSNISVAADGTISVASGAAQVNADWLASSGVAQILNKPPITSSGAEPTGSVTITASSTVHTSSSTVSTAVVINNTSSAHNYALVNYGSGATSPGAPTFLAINDLSVPQNVIAFAGTTLSRCAIVKLPSGGVFGWATDNNTPYTGIDIGLQRQSAGVLQVSDTNGNSMDLVCRNFTASGTLNVTGASTLQTFQAQQPSSVFPAFYVYRTVAGTEQISFTFDGTNSPVIGNAGGNNMLRFAGNVTANVQLASPNIAAVDTAYPWTNYLRLRMSGTQPTLDFGGPGVSSSLNVMGGLLVGNGLSVNTNAGAATFLLYGPSSKYFQILPNDATYADPRLYSTTGNIRVFCGMSFDGVITLYNAANITFGSNWTAWTPTISSGTMTVTVTSWMQNVYLRIGPLVFFHLCFTCNTGGTAVPNFSCSLPSGLSLVGGDYIPCSADGSVLAGGTYGYFRAFANASLIQLFVTSGNFPIMNGMVVRVSGFYRCA